MRRLCSFWVLRIPTERRIAKRLPRFGTKKPFATIAALVFWNQIGLCPLSFADDLPPIPNPEPLWSTYLGGSQSDTLSAVAVDSSGNVFVVGSTASSGWTMGGFDVAYNGGSQDVFVAKFSPNGAHLWSTYLGGDNQDLALAAAVDPSGNVCITGWTRSEGWVSGGFGADFNGGFQDAFVAKLAPDGELLWSTYLGGDDSEMGQGICVDKDGAIYVTGWTASGNWATGELAPSATSANAVDAFITKISPEGDHLGSRYIGGGYPDFASDIAVDAAGNVYLAGNTLYGLDPSIDPASDAFVMKISSTGETVWRTDLPGAGNDYGYGVTVDPSGKVYAVGSSQQPGWELGEIVEEHQGGLDAFVVRVSPTGSIDWTAFLGGNGQDQGRDVALDASGDLILIGETLSAGWVSGGFDAQHGGGNDGFLARLSPDGALRWSTYLGGSIEDRGISVAIDGAGGIVAGGSTQSPDWIADGFDVIHNGGFDAFVSKVVAQEDCPPSTLDAQRLLLSCKGGIAPGNPEGNLRLQFHAGVSDAPSCDLVETPADPPMVDCAIDVGLFEGPPDCAGILSILVAEIGACIDDQSGGLMSWSEVTGAGLVVHSQVEFHAILVGSETGIPDGSGLGRPLGSCGAYNLFDGVETNVSNLLKDYTGGLGFSLHPASCLPLPTPTPSNTPTNTPTPTPTVSFTPTVTPTASPSPTFTPSPSPTLTPTSPDMETPTPTLTNTHTATETMTPTPTETPTVTDQGPTPSSTPDYDLHPDEAINAKDLLLLLEGVRIGEGAAIGLFEFSAYWLAN